MKKIIQGQTFKNWKAVCDFMGWSNIGGSTKKKYLKQLEAICKYHKSGNSFIIDEVYEIPKEIVDNRGKHKNKGHSTVQYFPNYLVPKEHSKSIGVYSIILDNKIYIGSTMTGFRRRFLEHIRKQNPLPTREMLENGAVFKILQVCNGMDEPTVRELENRWIQEYKNNNEYVVVNINDAWSYFSKESREKEPKKKYKKLKIKVNENDYEKLLMLIEENGIDVKI